MAEKIRCEHILVEKQSLANQLLERIKKGESFEKLAQENSIDSSRKNVIVYK